MMQDCFRHLDRIEFVMTMACTGSCRHCSEGEHDGFSAHIDGDAAADFVCQVCADYPIQSLMTFGGEPLLYVEDVVKIHRAAYALGIPGRHIITNGYFSKHAGRIAEVAAQLAECGVTKVYLSVDAFHQETIPRDYVKMFAEALLSAGVFTQTHPAWLVSREDNNPYNVRTRELLAGFAEIGIAQSAGNVIFPSGNARKYLAAYFDSDTVYTDPYAEAPTDIRTLSVDPDGTLLGGNIYRQTPDAIMAAYRRSLNLAQPLAIQADS